MNRLVRRGEDQHAAEQLIARVAGEAWEYADADTQALTHSLHRYSGKFIPQIARRAIALTTAPGDIVLDPYCGSGTTVLEAALMRRRAVGFDLNPLAVLIARTKVTPLSCEETEGLRARLMRRIELRRSPDLFESFVDDGAGLKTKDDPRFNQDWYRKWFREEVLLELLGLHRAISAEAEPRLRALATVAFSEILRKSSNAHSGYPNVMFDKNSGVKRSPIPAFIKKLDHAIGMVASLAGIDGTWNDVQVLQASATAMPLADSCIDAIVTHPPYIGSIPYAEYGQLSLTWLGHDPKELDERLTGGRRQTRDVVMRFRADYSAMIAESERVLRPGGHMFIMIGDPVVRGEKVDLREMTLNLAAEANLVEVASTRRIGQNRRANKMGAEHLLFLRKPPQG